MTGVLLSQRVADEYGARIQDIGARCQRRLELAVCSPETRLGPEVIRDLEIAFYSRDVWEGTDKSFVNPATRAFFAAADAAPTLRWLQLTSAGADLPFYQPSIERGVRVTTSSGSNAEPISHTVAWAVLSFARGSLRWLEAQRKHEWSPLIAPHLPPDLRGQTAVILGTGPVGKAIARLLHVLGLTVIGVRRSARAAEHFDEVTTYDRLDTVLPRAQWLVIASPLSETTRGLIDGRRLALLPPEACVVNIARGEIIDEPALIDALARGRLAGAYLDVFAAEPLPPDSPLWVMPNVLITPHNCSASAGNAQRGVEIFLDNLARYLRGETLVNELG